MSSLSDSDGRLFAKLEPIPLGKSKCALNLIWAESADALPGSPGDAIPVFNAMLEELRQRGIRHFEARVITEQAGLDAQISALRSEWHHSVLLGLGFARGADRVEFRIDLDEAIVNLTPALRPPRLNWIPVATEPGALFERAVAVLRAVSVGDPDTDESDENEDPSGFLLARREDDDLVLPPESLQIGVLDGRDAALVVPSVQPKRGWCSHYYLGVIPECRGHGLSKETMHHGFQAMHALGGRTYHDGTRADNPAALALFRGIRAPLYRRLAEWRLS